MRVWPAPAYLIRDAGFDGANIHIFEGMPILGGSNDGAGSAREGFVCRGGRMLNEETYENFWELFSSIPSLEQPQRSVTEEILNFDHAHPTCAKARLVDRDAHILDVSSMGFDNEDRLAMTKLLAAPEAALDHMTISDWFGPHFFETNFWYMWQTTFAFQKWSSLFEFRRYMNRMIFEFSRIETAGGRHPYPLQPIRKRDSAAESLAGAAPCGLYSELYGRRPGFCRRRADHRHGYASVQRGNDRAGGRATSAS